MHLPFFLLSLLLIPDLTLAKPQQNPPGKNAILLSNVQSLTLRSGRQTTARRVPPLPQLTCIGPSKRICNLYTIDTMRCVNDGFDYDEEDVQWTCTASLPPEFKLGSTDVVCEGYRSADDKWVLKGSCAVEYRLLLTDKGEERFGRQMWESSTSQRAWSWLGNILFFAFFIVPLGLIFIPFLLGCLGLRRSRPGPNDQRHGRGGFWGGDGGYGPPPGPPPPYSRYPGSGWFDSTSSSQSPGPGFWSGALGGAFLGYGLGRRRSPTYDSPFTSRRGMSGRSSGSYDSGEGSSRSQSRFSSTTTSTGFGSTRRR